MKIVPCEEACHSDAILAIFNEAIATSTALYDYKQRTRETMKAWFETKRKGNFPVIVAEDANGELLGFASYGAFRAWSAYKYTVEHSVYVDSRFRGQGVGRALLQELIKLAEQNDLHVLIGAIDCENKPSIALHKSLGFTYSGTIRHAGFKFGRWLDFCFYQLILPTPHNPVDG